MASFASRRGTLIIKRVMTRRFSWRRAGKRLALTLGFTLIEMAIVLVVIGLIVSGGLVAIGPVVENANVNQTNQKLDRVEQALVVYVIRYSCLPCPADPASPGTGGVYTSSQAVSGTTAYSTSCATTGACQFAQGAVPWVNLGISEGDASDAFGIRFSYAVTPALALTASGIINGMQRVTSTYPGGTLDVSNNAGTVITLDASYVLISHGPDRSYGRQMTVGGAAIPAAPFASTFEQDNSTGPTYRQSDYSSDKAGTTYFDDIVRWRSAPFVIQQCGANSCGNPL